MPASGAVLSVAFALLASAGYVSCTLYINHRVAPRTSYSDRLPAEGISQGILINEGDNSVMTDSDIFRRTVQDADSPEEVEVEEEDQEGVGGGEGDSDVPTSFAQLGRPSLDRSGSEMLSFFGSSDSSSTSTTSSSSSSSPSISSSSASLSSSQPSRRPPSSRMNIMSLPQLEESRRRSRARQRELRAESFRRTISTGLGIEQAPSTSINPETRRALLNWLLQRQQTGTTQLAQRVHVERNCYLGQCTAPLGVNSSLWQDLASHNLRLNFPLPRSNRRRARNEEVQRAELSLFVQPRDGCPCRDEYGDPIPGYVVSVHQFTRRLVMRKGRVVHRTNLLGSVRIPFGGNAWLRMDVTRAAQIWMARPRRNLGLEIRVRHTNGTAVDARSVLGLPDCLAAETERSCVHGSRPGIEVLPWPHSWHDRYLQTVQGRPYLDLRVVDRSRTTVDLAQAFGSSPRRLGNLEDFFASQ